LRKADFRKFTLVSSKDSTKIPALLYKRLREQDSALVKTDSPDSIQLDRAITRYQKKLGWKVDGKISAALISRLNNSDREKFIRIAINLDRYRQLPVLPAQYIWVNLPAYYLKLVDSDSIVIRSKVVVGKPTTKTPVITSSISDMITYPKWYIPQSIIKKDILPGLKRDPGYLARKGYSLVDKEGNEVNPYQIKWAKFQNTIPYHVVQGSGDDNALGVIKFNFPNKYAVYLHDTNQRYLFSKSSRALSHGCVRVQAWKELATYILRRDSLVAPNAIPVDSMASWLERKEKHYIPVRQPIPLFIRYVTCEANSGKILFYEDIYGEDKRIREKIFADK
jgi:murein L,D-transpeptidase YcbB/YkuD